MSNYLFTSESVTEGHPDKVCDTISDAILDELLKQDPNARVACECACTTGQVHIMGEISSNAVVDYPAIARNSIKEIGYTDSKMGFDANTCAIIVSIDKQSEDIALGVDNSLEAKDNGVTDENKIGAGDQGMMFGFACNETDEYMPLPISLAHKLSKRLAVVRKNGMLPYLYPDGKTQVTVKYENDIPKSVDTIVVSAQHNAEVKLDELRNDIINHVIKQIIPSKLICEETKIYVNPTGRFVIGGPHCDTGFTGRKIIVDTYGGYARHGGGAFSGKDPTKVDRSATYAARWIAKNLVAAGIANKIEVQIAYAIGVAEPVSVMVDTFGTGCIEDGKICELINKIFDLRPAVIINTFDLRKPIYKQLASYGHFGRDDLDLPWEQLNMVDKIQNEVKNCL